MSHLPRIPALALLLLAPFAAPTPAFAAAAEAAVAVGDALGVDEASIRQALVERGYEVRRIEIEDGELEAYALRDGKRFEIHVRAGAVTRITSEN